MMMMIFAIFDQFSVAFRVWVFLKMKTQKAILLYNDISLIALSHTFKKMKIDN